MKIKRTLSLIAIWTSCVSAVMATDFLVEDFDSYPIGHPFPIWNNFGDSSQATTAIVETDPLDASNKVLHVVNRGWNDHVEFKLPSEFAGQAFADRIETVEVRLCRHRNDPCGEWKNFQIFLGEEKLHEESWPSYGPVSTWKTWSYAVPTISSSNTSAYLRLGFNSENSDYYIDNVRIKGPDFTVFPEGELNFSNPQSTSSSYTEYSDGISIPSGTELNVFTSRYTFWLSKIKGSGRLNIHSGGERSYIGNNSGQLPDWSGFSGEIHIFPWPEVNPSVSAGFYGEILAHGGVKFDPGNAKQSIKDGKFTTTLASNRLTIRDGAVLAGEDGNNARAHRIGSLSMERGSRLMGYYKGNKQKGVYYLVGSDGDNSKLYGRIAAEGTSPVGLVKEGSGSYFMESNDNKISGGVFVVGGELIISNDAEEARAQKLSGPIGAGAGNLGVMVYSGALLRGSGNISGKTDIYGYLQPGISEGTLYIADFETDAKCDLLLHPTSRLIFNISGVRQYSDIDVSGALTFSPRDEARDLSGAMPIVELRVSEFAALHSGDSFTLLKASSKEDADNWKFRVQYPKAYTWEVVEEEDASGYRLVAKVVSEVYSGQGDIEIPDEKVLDGDDNSDFIVDWSSDYSDSVSLRELAAKAGKYIGVAVPVWKFNLSDINNAKTRTVAEQFNLVVAENEMKIDATEPSEGNFTLGNAWKLVDFADTHGIDVRGHTLVWHQQVPAWISQDGKKNNKNWTRDQLLRIMKNHINGVAGAMKGRVREWDVVNECLDDDQSIIWSNPAGYKLRSTVWKDVIGESFLEEAFRAAREADPDALLYINDYGVEMAGEPKAEAYYNLVKKLVEKGVPIDGVGLQCHFTSGQFSARKLKDNIRRYEELGLKCIITELDITQANPKADDAALRQAEDYCAVVMAALSQSNCPTVLIWGLCDPDSWRDNNPLLFDGNVKPKDAYYAVHAALRTIADRSESEILPDVGDGRIPVSVEFYDIHGIRLEAPCRGLTIAVTRYSDGTSSSRKIFK